MISIKESLRVRNNTLALFFDLHKTKFQRSFTSEDLDHDFEFVFLRVNLFNHTTKAREWTVSDFHRLVDYIRYCYLVDKFCLLRATEHTVDVRLRYRSRIIQTTKETQHIGHKAQRVRSITNEIGLNKYITRKRNSLLDYTLAITQRGIFLQR